MKERGGGDSNTLYNRVYLRHISRYMNKQIIHGLTRKKKNAKYKQETLQ